MGKKITSNHFQVKRTSFGAVQTVDFKPNMGKKTQTAPEIDEHYVDDAGDIMLILKNGNTQSKISYEAMWGKLKNAV